MMIRDHMHYIHVYWAIFIDLSLSLYIYIYIYWIESTASAELHRDPCMWQ